MSSTWWKNASFKHGPAYSMLCNPLVDSVGSAVYMFLNRNVPQLQINFCTHHIHTDQQLLSAIRDLFNVCECFDDLNTLFFNPTTVCSHERSSIVYTRCPNFWAPCWIVMQTGSLCLSWLKCVFLQQSLLQVKGLSIFGIRFDTPLPRTYLLGLFLVLWLGSSFVFIVWGFAFLHG